MPARRVDGKARAGAKAEAGGGRSGKPAAKPKAATARPGKPAAAARRSGKPAATPKAATGRSGKPAAKPKAATARSGKPAATPKAAAARAAKPKAATSRSGKPAAKPKAAARGGCGLKAYEAKRDFAATPEPAPTAGGADAAGQPRFVIHEHHARRLHWDLRLEHDGALASWAVPKGMPEAPGENRFAAHTEDHPIEYLDFHGEIPAGNYGAGKMTIWDRGTYECLKWEPRKVEVLLHGERLNARYALFPIDKEDPPKDWMVHRMDPPADTAREAMPRKIVPMMARPGALPPDDESWGYEIKWDGVRAIAYSTPGELRLESRNLNDISDSYPELARLSRSLGSRSAVLDGEIVAFDAEARPSFSRLQ
ncbi:MAG TPA: DNA polymerase ligase N-terminal domain-containing protein, partial [Solirubrobacteraceae bacterium]